MPRHSVKSVVFGIPLHRAPFEDSDADALVAALRRGALTGDGPATHALAAAARASVGCRYAFATPRTRAVVTAHYFGRRA
jgi:dTDP-4-amino-4,6-dideoxygalactose transaminase